MLDQVEQALGRLDQLAPKARTRADLGDPSALVGMLDGVLARSARLRDEGALRELGAVAPAAADRFASYLAFPFSREAKARAAFATSELVAGKARWRAAEAMARLRLGDAAERASALQALEALSLEELEEIAPARRACKAAAKVEPAKVGSILMATPELMAELGLVSASPEAGTREGPDRSKELGELVRQLAESVGRAALEYGELRVAAAAREVADFRVRHPLVGRGTIPFEQPGAPLARAGARAIDAGDAASSAALAGVDGASAALAFAATTPAFAECLADAGSDRRRTARAMAASVGLLALDCQLAGHAVTLEDFSDRERDALGFSRPRWLARLLWVGARFELAPGEDTARYAGGAQLEKQLVKGAAVAFDLRDRFDEDWFRNPRVTREVLDDGVLAVTGSIDQVVDWLKESCRR